MTIDEIKTFITLAQCENFSRAAQLLFTSQSTISFRIRNMEAQLGKPLFNRSTRHIELTPAGKDFLYYATQMNDLYEKGLQASTQNSYAYKVSIGAPDSFWQTILLPALTDHFRYGLNVSFELISEHSVTLTQMLLAGKLDIGISFIPFHHTNLNCVSLAKCRFVLVAQKDYPLPHEKLTLNNVFSFPLIYCKWGNPFDDWFQENYGIGSHAIELDRTWLFLQMLLNKVGAGFMPLRMAKQFLDSGELVEIPYDNSGEAPLEENFIIYNKNDDKLIPVVSIIQAYIDNHGLTLA